MTFCVGERCSALLRGVFTREDGSLLTAADVLTLKATLSDRLTDVVINGRSAQDVKSTNGGTYTGTDYTLRLSDVDNPVLDPSLDVEEHLLLLEWTWAGGGAGTAEVVLAVKNRARK